VKRRRLKRIKRMRGLGRKTLEQVVADIERSKRNGNYQIAQAMHALIQGRPADAMQLLVEGVARTMVDAGIASPELRDAVETLDTTREVSRALRERLRS
jgi:hypothetical protein